MATLFLEQYEPLDIIGNGSFGIIRKVRRKSDGAIFARKELNFERMSERDRKQIVAEVNILKDLQHENIVRYHDRYVDREAGILYILMEYCSGGDLSTIIKQAQRHNKPLPEDTIWNYFMQILLALQQCHHPNGHGRNGSTGTSGFESDSTNQQRRMQILHRDLKPDNIFLSESNTVKLGDFGLSKALAHTSFANTYVGTPYYMSPELMQEKAYDSKSDIWSLGCLIYELCALKPPFHEAKTHAELSILIRNGRIPPLPKGYSQSLGAVIKSMLNLNPAMRPSAAQLLQNERLDLVLKISEAEKMFATVKSHRTNLMSREREIVSRETACQEREQQLSMVVSQRDAEIASMKQALAQSQEQQQRTQAELETAVREAIAKREQELRVLVLKREEEVAAAMAKREEEIIASVNRREQELNDAWTSREEQIRKEVEERVRWVEERATWVEERATWVETREKELEDVEGWLDGVRIELEEEEKRLDDVRSTVEENMKKWEETAKGRTASKGRTNKPPLEEVKNLLEPLSRLGSENAENDSTPVTAATAKPPRKNQNVKPRSPSPFPGLATPAPAPSRVRPLPPASAMKGVVLTSTGELLATPAHGPVPFTPSPPGATITPTALPSVDLTKLFVESPKVGLDFGKIFERTDGSNAGHSETDNEDRTERLSKGWEGVRTINPDTENEEDDDDESPPPSPSWRKEKEFNRTSSSRSWGREASARRRERTRDDDDDTQKSSGSSNTSSTKKQGSVVTAPPTRLRRPSIRRRGSGALPGSVSDSMNLNGNGSSSQKQKPVPLPLPHPHLHSNSSEAPAGTCSGRVMQRTHSAPASAQPAVDFDLDDDENLPSPFLKRVEKERSVSTNSLGFHGNNPTGTVAGRKRASNGNNLLRAVAAVNSAAAHERGGSGFAMTPASGNTNTRASTLSARKASEEARKALSR
ncbi:hypothetical protein V5O48_008697 [Marasmius crinis-equi]|uniref:non-specific serine/threonine protein kinase n=1 Tax=Marasmius crinis-equi TaxID=585013 RepID=A0ABR3FD67_9AGAR